MLFKNGFNVISVQIQRILMWRFWTVRDLNLEWELYAIPLYLPTSHFLYITPESAVLPPQSCTYLVSSGQHTAGGPQIGVNNFWNFWNNLDGHMSRWFLLFFSDFPVFQFVTFNCSYDIDYMPKNIEIKKFKGFKHLPMYQVCCLPLVYCFKYNQFVKKTFMLRSTRNPFLHPLSGVPQASTPMALWRWCTHLFSHRELVWLAADFGPHFYCLHKQKDLILQ